MRHLLLGFTLFNALSCATGKDPKGAGAACDQNFGCISQMCVAGKCVGPFEAGIGDMNVTDSVADTAADTSPADIGIDAPVTFATFTVDIFKRQLPNSFVPVAGADVEVVGDSSNATTTSQNGRASLQVAANQVHFLRVSKLGHVNMIVGAFVPTQGMLITGGPTLTMFTQTEFNDLLTLSGASLVPGNAHVVVRLPFQRVGDAGPIGEGGAYGNETVTSSAAAEKAGYSINSTWVDSPTGTITVAKDDNPSLVFFLNLQALVGSTTSITVAPGDQLPGEGCFTFQQSKFNEYPLEQGTITYVIAGCYPPGHFPPAAAR